MKSKKLAIVLLGAMAASAHASFEMALFMSGGAIHRYDAENQIYLGSFGSNRLYSIDGALSINPLNQNEVYVYSFEGGIRKFNWGTGEYLGGFNSGASYYGNTRPHIQALSNGNFLLTSYEQAGSSTLARLVNGSGTTITTFSTLGYTILDSKLGADGRIYSIARTASGPNYTYYLFQYSTAGTYLGFSNLGTSTAQDRWGTLAMDSSRIYLGNGGNTSSPGISYINYGTGQTITNRGGSGYVTTGWSELLNGHYGNIHQTQSWYNSTTTQYDTYYYQYDPISDTYGRYMKVPVLTNYVYSTALATAPEPGEWLALSVGIAALLLRRKRK